MHFVLSAQAASPSTAVAVRMTIFDSTGAIVASLLAYNGQDPVSLTRALGAGTYTVLFTAYAPPGVTLPSVQYTLQASRLDDPIGPQPSDSTTAPSGSSGSSGSSTTTSSNSSTATNSSSGSYYYYSPSSNSSMSPQDPYSNPYAPN
jgi:hypothetical protein